MKIFADIKQGSDEWHSLRRGKPTASRASDIITAAKGDFSKSARKYLIELIAECGWDGKDIPDFTTAAMSRGTALEADAREAFIAETGLSVAEVGLCLAEDGICACSPDGLVSIGEGEFGSGLEIKCPLKESHAEYVFDGGLPDSYKAQVHWSLAVTGLKQWHFWSFHPCYKPLHVTVGRDAYTAKVEAAMVEFVKLYRETYVLAQSKLFIPAELLAE